MKTIKEVISAVAKAEGKKHEATVGDVREVISELKKLVKSSPEAMTTVAKYLGVKTLNKEK